MKQIVVNLQQTYRSLDAGTTFEFNGDLIILSGVNGSGKSHLADILRGYSRRNQQESIARNLTIDGVNIGSQEILMRVFGDTIHTGDNGGSNSQNILDNQNQIWNSYENSRFDPNHQVNTNYISSARRLREYFIEKMGIELFQSGVSRDELIRNIPTTILWQPDDVFHNFVVQIFNAYARRKQYQVVQRALGRESEEISEAPWTTINVLFQELGFEYRFRDDYELNESNELTHTISLHPVDNEENVDFTQQRNISELSDGEKALITLAYSSITDSHSDTIKLLILDEFDAPLNPSLTKMFYQVVEHYFTRKDIAVIVITHSPATISMAPDSASFYEMFKPNTTDDSSSRIQRATRDEYADMQVALAKYFDQIIDNESRLEELEAQNQLLESLVSPSGADGKIQIISEGDNIKHIQHAIEVVRPNLINKLNFVTGAEAITGNTQLITAFNIHSKAESTLKFVYVWDVDTAAQVEGLENTSQYIAFCFAPNENNHVSIKNGKPVGIENLYPDHLFDDQVYSMKVTPTEYGGEASIKLFDKSKFRTKVEAINEVEIFENFNPLIELLDGLTT